MLITLFSIIGAIIGMVLIALVVVLINSPGKLPSLKDEQGNPIPGSISEKVWLEIGGIRQGMFIRGENPENPVILYVGLPESKEKAQGNGDMTGIVMDRVV